MLRTLLLVGLTALAYAGAGWAALQLTVPPNYICLVFIPSGVALGAVLVGGARLLPGVALGAMAVHWLAHQQAGAPAWDWVFAVSPLGATAMAALSAWAIRRWAGYPSALDEPKQAALAFLVIIPAGALLNASLSVPLLVLAGIVPAHDAGFSWVTWWVADALGAALFTPLMLVLFGAPADAWRPRWRTVAVPMALALLLVAGGLWLQTEHQHHTQRLEAEQANADLSQRLQRRLDAQTDSVEAMALLLGLAARMDQATFASAGARWLERYPGTHNFGWSPRVLASERAQYESRDPGRPVLGRTPQGQTFAAPPAPQYLPITLVAPLAPNRAALGLDVGVLPATASAVQAALASGRPQATEGFRLVQEAAEQKAVVVYQAAHHPDGALRGVVSAVFRMDDVVQSLTANAPPLCLVDRGAAPAKQRLAGPEGCEQVGDRASTFAAQGWPLHFAGREWTLYLPPAAHPAGQTHLDIWVSTTVGLLAVSLLGTFLIVITGQGRRTAQLVAERTHELAHSNASLLRLAHFDALTGLANRSFWTDQAEATLAAARDNGKQVAVVFLDLDRFKHVNDSLGHSQGDELLVTVSARIQACLRARDVLARFGGDEFVALLPWVRDPDGAATVAHKVALALAQPIVLDGMQVTVTGSIGVALYPEHGGSVNELLRHADTAMYAAKAAGRNQWRFFEPAMHAHVSRRLGIESGLRLALELNAPELSLAYQPQVDARTGQVLGLEALLRWQHPTLGALSPQEFVPVAEEAGIIEVLGQWVLGTVCRQIQAWADGPHPERFAALTVAVNVSPLEFNRPHFMQHLESALAQMREPPGRLELEITESLLVHASTEVIHRMERLTERGIGLSLDDFGTGYSSLSYLKRLPLHKLKIDRSFVTDVPGNPEGEAIIRAMLSMAHDLGLQVVAEGVETPAQRDFLHQHGCDALQGWLYARALPAHELADWLATHTPRPADPPHTAP